MSTLLSDMCNRLILPNNKCNEWGTDNALEIMSFSSDLFFFTLAKKRCGRNGFVQNTLVDKVQIL